MTERGWDIILDHAPTSCPDPAKPEKTEGSHKEGEVRTSPGLLAVGILVLVATDCARCDEPPVAAEAPVPVERAPRLLTRIRDRWVQRTQGTTQPRSPAPPEPGPSAG